MTKIRSLMWPSTDDYDGSRRAALQGVYAAAFSAAVTLLAALAAGIGKSFWGSSVAGLIDASIFAFIAWRIFRMSRTAAVLGLIWYASGRFAMLMKSPAASAAVSPVVAIFLLMYVNSIRGTFAHRRRHETSSSAGSIRWSRPALWKTAAATVLAAGVIGLLIALTHPRAPIL